MNGWLKTLISSFATFTALLYVAGYIAEHSHARMLGISGVEPAKDYYLVVGGKFFISSLYALFSTIISPYCFVYFIFFIPIFVLFTYEKYIVYQSETAFNKSYLAIVCFITIFIGFIVTPVFTYPFLFKDLILTQARHPLWADFGLLWSNMAFELRSWILNYSPVNKQKLNLFFTILILTSVFTSFLLWSAVRQWKRLGRINFIRYKPTKIKKITINWRRQVHRSFTAISLLLLTIVCAVLILTIPVDYGVLLIDNHYPEVKIDIAGKNVHPPIKCTVELFEDANLNKEYKLWLLRENKTETLLYAVYFNKGDEITYRLLTIKKNVINKIEKVDNSFIFAIK